MLSRSPARPCGRCGQDRWLPRRPGPGSRYAESQRRRPLTMGETPGSDPRPDGPDPAAHAEFPTTAIIAGVRTRVMYIESKAEGLSGPARIGRVSFSKT